LVKFEHKYQTFAQRTKYVLFLLSILNRYNNVLFEGPGIRLWKAEVVLKKTRGHAMMLCYTYIAYVALYFILH